jgi:threonine synthase
MSGGAPATSVERRAAFRTVCTGCGRELRDGFNPFCPVCGEMSDVTYDLASVELRESSNPYVRFLDLLPIRDPALLPPDAQYTPCVHAHALGREIGLSSLWLKDETVLPTGTTKDRMAAVALPYLLECGVRGFTTSSTGNSSSAYARALARVPGVTMYVFTASSFRDRVEIEENGQVVDVVLEDATFVEAFDAAGEFAEARGLVSERGFFNPGRREGLKLAWLEAAEQVPGPIDWYVQAVSSAMGVYGVYKAAREMRELGLADRLPRLLCVQQETCAPMVTAWRADSDHIRAQDVVSRPTGIATAILRGDPTRAYPPVRRLVEDSDGTFTAVSEAEIRAAHHLLREREGITACFAGATALAGLIKLRAAGGLSESETVVVNVTGSERPPCRTGPRTYVMPRGQAGWDLGSIPSGEPRPAIESSPKAG